MVAVGEGGWKEGVGWGEGSKVEEEDVQGLDYGLICVSVVVLPLLPRSQPRLVAFLFSFCTFSPWRGRFGQGLNQINPFWGAIQG